ncbi:phosphatase PAP2 family protein [Peredibacter sp. HCB2-198]|uniref:phosphatase PAP2 family protein n=1 Tax=Peredibacter sp. HCB2-198 TaxID=3383025 RepID=UPI0038B60224
MHKLLALLTAFYIAGAQAKPSCLIDNTCMEYNGQLIDLRTGTDKLMDKAKNCDPLIENCSMKNIEFARTPEFSRKEFQRLVGEGGTQYFIPLDVTKSDLMILAGALSLGTVVFANDREIMDFVQDNKGEFSQQVATVGNLLGREAILPVAAGAYFMGAILDNGKLKNVGIFTVAAGLASQIVAEGFKKTFHRVRPHDGDSPYDFFEEGNNSFISGHAAGAFSLATVIAEVYKDKPAVPYIAYGLATLTVYARMHDNKHWGSDVLAGAVAAHLVTKILMRTVLNPEREDGSGFLIIPQFGRDHAGKAYTGVEIQWRPKAPSRLSQCEKSKLQGRELMALCFEEAFNK